MVRGRLNESFAGILGFTNGMILCENADPHSTAF
jgi:hypothetical protein